MKQEAGDLIRGRGGHMSRAWITTCPHLSALPSFPCCSLGIKDRILGKNPTEHHGRGLMGLCFMCNPCLCWKVCHYGSMQAKGPKAQRLQIVAFLSIFAWLTFTAVYETNHCYGWQLGSLVNALVTGQTGSKLEATSQPIYWLERLRLMRQMPDKHLGPSYSLFHNFGLNFGDGIKDTGAPDDKSNILQLLPLPLQGWSGGPYAAHIITRMMAECRSSDDSMTRAGRSKTKKGWRFFPVTRLWCFMDVQLIGNRGLF